MDETKTTELTFDEALALLDKGNAIRLPEWEGYWFEGVWKNGDPSQVLVFTKHGDILNTPHIQQHQHRNDWQVADPEKLDFGFAVRALKNGKLVARRGWNGKGMFLFLRPSDSLSAEFIVEKVKSLPQSFKNHVAGQFAWDSDAIEKDNGPRKTEIAFGAYICMKAADGTIVNGWLASQTDILAEDWVIIQDKAPAHKSEIPEHVDPETGNNWNGEPVK